MDESKQKKEGVREMVPLAPKEAESKSTRISQKAFLKEM